MGFRGLGFRGLGFQRFGFSGLKGFAVFGWGFRGLGLRLRGTLYDMGPTEACKTGLVLWNLRKNIGNQAAVIRKFLFERPFLVLQPRQTRNNARPLQACCARN